MKRSARLQPPSRQLLAAARPYLRRYTAKQFSGLRIATDGAPPRLGSPTIFYANHPSWWDPIVLLLLIRNHYADWRFHGPIDQAALDRYPWLERLGLFGLAPDTMGGARRFLEVGAELLTQERTGIALTAQGRFADARQRPLELRPGLSRLLSRHPRARAVPIAIEYVFWNERLPEILVRFGRSAIGAHGRPRAVVHAELEASLETELDRLAAQAMARDPAAFTCLIDGRRGVGLLQDLPHRLRSLFRGERFDPSHSAVGRNGRQGR